MKITRLIDLSDISTVILLAGIFGVGLIAFVPSYFLVLDSTSLSMHIHALLMYLWLGGAVCMAILIRTRQYRWHRRIGYASPLVVLAMLYSGFIVIFGSQEPSFSGQTLKVLARWRLPVMTIVSFSILYLLGLAFRKHPQVHFRFMLSTVIVLIGPALRRILLLIPSTKPDFATISFLLLGALTLALIALDIRKGYVKTPYFLTLALLALMLVGYHYWWELYAFMKSVVSVILPLGGG
ncbi:MAG: hypothetical protein QNI86_13090 [Halieaceae bacterium]|nr:hypothetical protein [Halieaceae bacterium]